jgi:hypothetical protein
VSYTVIINFVKAPTRREEFRGVGCRGRMLRRYHDLVQAAESSSSQILQIDVLGTIGDNIETMEHWRRGAGVDAEQITPSTYP